MEQRLLEVDIDIDEEIESLLSPEEMHKDIELVLQEEGVTRPCMLSLSIVSEERMRELNRDWRGVDRVTDVISLECESPKDLDLAPGEPCELGDIVLAPSFIASQAASFGTTPADECRLLLVHGVLHLLGYDHLDDDEAEAMEAREEELLGMISCDEAVQHVRLTRHRAGVDE